MATITILGAGMMGTAFAWPLVDRGHAVRLVGTHLDDAIIESIRDSRRHPKLDLVVPAGVTALPLSELESALDGSDAIALGVSSAGVRWAGERLAPLLDEGLPLAMVAKGLDWNGEKLRILPDALRDALGRGGVEPVAVAGPCIAGELARRVPTCVLFAARSRAAAETWAEFARGPYYHVFSDDEPIGVEVCAALKNAYAMGVAVPAGVHRAAGGGAGSIGLHNTEAALFAQSIFEMRRVIELLGGRVDTASFLAGVGDLDVTCNGGRTGRFGELLGRGFAPEEARAQMAGATLECLEILSVLRRATEAYRRSGVLGPDELPLAEHLAELAFDGARVNWPFARFFRGEA
jgi:glycerol-3-phosphate dehydrogenase (NAD(P)+)